MKHWLEGQECDWFRTADPNARVFALPYVCRYESEAGLELGHIQVDGDTAKVVSRSPAVLYHHDALIDTVFGKWPPPIDMLAALARNEVSGRSRGRMLYAAYWTSLAHSRELREWVAGQFPAYWDLLVRGAPEMK